VGRKGKQAKQAEIFAPDGRKILTQKEWNDALRKRIRERALAIIKEKDEQTAMRSLGSLMITIGKISIKATKPDYNGKIEKVLEFTATVPFSQKAENLISANLQEPLSCELKPKQIGMNLPKDYDREPMIPEEFEQEAMKAVGEDKDVKAALEDLCTCGHARKEHFEERGFGTDDDEMELDQLGPCISNGECECDNFVPLKPGEKPTPMTGEEGDEPAEDQE
jgi:hypothetical protein